MIGCKELDLEYIIVYTEADKDSEHVRRNITRGPEQNSYRIASYNDPNELFAVADHTGCTAIHPGYGVFAEDYRFARRATTRDRPLSFIGPDWKVIRDLGNKINCRRLASKLGIPTIPGSVEPILNEQEAEEIAEKLLDDQRKAGIHSPSILIKAAAGGGGMGIEEVTDIEQVRRVYRYLQSYAKRQFGDGGLLIEQCLRNCNHLEVQILNSTYGERLHFGTSNCTVHSTGRQKRLGAAPGFHRSCYTYDFDEQKVLDQIIEYSLKLADYVNYDSFGTWEWLVSSAGHPYLLEVNTRIQLENDLSSRISYVDGMQPDLIREQIRLALGQRIGHDQKAVELHGAAIGLRIVAEDTSRGFAPWTGTVTNCTFPKYSWAAVSSHVPGDIPYPIPTEYDPILALVLVWGDTMDDAKKKAVRFIKKTVIRGRDADDNQIITNLDYLKDNLDRLLAY